MSEKKEYIERSKVIDIAYWITLESGYERKMVEVDCVENMPAADVEPVVRGEYITDDLGDSSCSVCGEKWLNVTHKRCPNCAAYLERSGSGE